jgi:hypothetical protein
LQRGNIEIEVIRRIIFGFLSADRLKRSTERHSANLNALNWSNKVFQNIEIPAALTILRSNEVISEEFCQPTHWELEDDSAVRDSIVQIDGEAWSESIICGPFLG